MIYDANFEIEQNFVQTKREKKTKGQHAIGGAVLSGSATRTKSHADPLFFCFFLKFF